MEQNNYTYNIKCLSDNIPHNCTKHLLYSFGFTNKKIMITDINVENYYVGIKSNAL